MEACVISARMSSILVGVQNAHGPRDHGPAPISPCSPGGCSAERRPIVATKAPSQAAQVAALLTKANERLLDAWVALSDGLEIASNPDGEQVPPEEALALVGRVTVAKRHAAWVSNELVKVERAMLEQNDYASEGSE
jgi:hypothetical protein